MKDAAPCALSERSNATAGRRVVPTKDTVIVESLCALQHAFMQAIEVARAEGSALPPGGFENVSRMTLGVFDIQVRNHLLEGRSGAESAQDVGVDAHDSARERPGPPSGKGTPFGRVGVLAKEGRQHRFESTGDESGERQRKFYDELGGFGRFDGTVADEIE